MQSLAHIALVVRDYDEAIAWFIDKLGFLLVADESQSEQDKRWVLVAPPGSKGTSLLLARASSPGQEAFIGNQAGGRVFLFLETDDFGRDHAAMCAKGVRFVRAPKAAPYGTVAVFEDLYGNLWDLVQFARQRRRRGGRQAVRLLRQRFIGWTPTTVLVRASISWTLRPSDRKWLP
jgi:catechol 2,3-dioxygenase-like lactoylglutathione lyase family enzyme